MKFTWRHLSLLVIAVFSLNCFKEPLSPVMPTWDANATFPLGTRTYTLADLIAKDTALLKSSGGRQISVSKSAQIAPTFVSNYLTLSPKDTSVQLQLGAFAVNPPDERQPVQIPWLPQGWSVPVPDTTMHLSDVRSTIASFQSMTLKSGTITLRLENNLPVAMEVVTPIQMLDAQGNVMATFSFSPSSIPPRGYLTATDDLSLRTITSDYRITGLQFHTPGSMTPVLIPTGDLLVATLSTNNLKARQAVLNEVPAQRLADNDTAKLRIDDSTCVKELYFKSGSLNFAFRNNISLAMMFKVSFNELQRKTGSSYVPYVDSVYLGPNGTASMTVNVAGARVRGQNGNLVKVLGVMGSVGIYGSSGQQITLSETDMVSIAVTKNSPLVVDSAMGVLKPTWVNLDTKVPLNLGKVVKKFSGQLNLPSAQLGLTTNSSVGFPADAYIMIGAQKLNGDSVYIQVPASQRRIQPGQGTIQFDGTEVGRFLSQLAGKLPDSLRVSGRILVNPPDVYNPTISGVAGVGSNSAVSGAANVTIPLNLGIVDGTVKDTIIIGDTTANGKKGFTIDQSYIDHYNSGTVYIELENGLPAEITFNTALLNKAWANLLTIPQSGQLIHLGAAQVDANGNVIATTKSTTAIALNQQEVSQYNPSEFVSFAVGIKTTAGSPTVQFKTDNQVRVRVWTSLSGKVSK